MPYHLVANIITSIGILCATISIFASVLHQINLACWLILVAIVMDILDGKTARLLMPTDDFGKEFDSLADIICFGIAPIVLLRMVFGLPTNLIWTLLSFVYILCAALRLARFNIHKGRSRYASFIGLPTTAAAGFIVSSILLSNSTNLALNPLYAKITLLILAVLMVSRLPYPNSVRISQFIWILASVVLVASFIMNKALSIFVAFLSYIVLGPFFVLGRKTSE